MDYLDIDDETEIREESEEKSAHELRLEKMRAEKIKQAEKMGMKMI